MPNTHVTAPISAPAARSEAPSVGTERVASGVPRLAATRTIFLVAALALLAIAVLGSLWVGARGIAFAEVWQALWHADGGETSYIVHEMRLPRAALALLVGGALGTAGALIQALTRNPLADTGILGVGAGANLAVVVAIGLFGVTAMSQYLWFAFGGAVLVTAAVYALGSMGSLGATPVRLTLVGVALGALLGGFAGVITMLHPDAFSDMLRWSAGSLAGRGWGTVATVLAPITIGLGLGAVSGRALNAVSLGDDLARSLGANVVRTRIIVIVAVTLLAGAATAAAGPIGFVGLMVPHVVRWFTGPDQRWIIPFSAVAAALLLLSSDIIGRVVLAPKELEVGIVTAVVGAPVLIVLARRRQVSTL
ncbi:FecCD family ABC transporter permease [Leucobacter japonicus]|uniref:FecCD family ABC transporter permease n=1 Tax=Leucobacter japonicus TaxID=1461259 RepID=UPI0006A7CE6A|nr:iron chelate uptake ABC transporter family permease subunit [Leucobacter japonicus]